jgi:hypothetical protein
MRTNSEKQKQHTTGPLKDVSRFNRWVHQMDAKDQSLNPRARKGKWIATLSILFALFVLSFILFPSAEVKHEKMQGIRQEEGPVNTKTTVPAPLEMPVDSFEQQLKQKIHEDLPEKE